MRVLSLQEENIDTRLRWLMLSRVAIVTFLLMVITFINIQKTEIFPEKALTSLYVLCALTYFLSLAYLLVLKFVKKIETKHIYPGPHRCRLNNFPCVYYGRNQQYIFSFLSVGHHILGLVFRKEGRTHNRLCLRHSIWFIDRSGILRDYPPHKRHICSRL